MVINAAVEAEKNTRTMKAAVKPVIGIHQPRIFMGMFGGNTSTKMAGLGSSFKYEEINSMLAEEMG